MAQFNLLKFIPFQLNRLAAQVSDELATVYADEYGISTIEWRIIATLAAHGSYTAQRISHSTRTHKSRISRAASRLTEKGLVQRLDNGQREVQLRLTRKGSALHKKIAPVVLEKEQEILSCLSEKERRDFFNAIEVIERSLGLVQHTEQD